MVCLHSSVCLGGAVRSTGYNYGTGFVYEEPGLNPPPCHQMDLCLVVLNSTPSPLVNRELVCIQPFGIDL